MTLRMISHSEVRFFVQGIPKGQPRPRVARQGGRAWAYNPSVANEWKNMVKAVGLQNRPDKPIEGPVAMQIDFFMARPKRLKKGEAGYSPVKPDIDNLVKAVMDSLNDTGIWGDDNQVVELSSSKKYCAEGEYPGAQIAIEAI
jgi:Holliday junction resolvase RusA-like endonuclease